MKISIIIPVYQVEKYLQKCVDSVLSQLHTNVELILVDDGSQDSSGKMCDEYSRQNQNVITLHKKNGGLSSARNFGMAHASGEYIMFLDSDDWLEQGCIVRFLDYIDRYKSDLIVAKAFLVDENGRKKSKIDYKIYARFYKIAYVGSIIVLLLVLVPGLRKNCKWGKKMDKLTCSIIIPTI